MVKKNRMVFNTAGIDPVSCAKEMAAIAMGTGTPVYWVHEDGFRFLVQPWMTCEEVADIVRGGEQQYIEGIPVLWTGEDNDELQDLLNVLDLRLREYNLGKIVCCCDIREGICGGSCDKPFQFPDGTYAVAMFSNIERKVKAVLEHISQIPQLVAVNMTTSRMVLAEASSC